MENLARTPTGHGGLITGPPNDNLHWQSSPHGGSRLSNLNVEMRNIVLYKDLFCLEKT